MPTVTATEAIDRLAPRLGMSVDDLYTMNQGAMLSVEAAGAGFAVAIAQAHRYSGQEISSSQALVDAGIAVPAAATPSEGAASQATAPEPPRCATPSGCRHAPKRGEGAQGGQQPGPV